MENDKIVIIDDNQDNRKLIEQALKPVGGVFMTFANADSALGHIRKEKPDLIISDVNMPGMDGFQLTETIRSDKYLRGVPIILVTGMNTRDLKMKGLRAGCDDFLNKPFDLSELQARVRSLLRISYYQRQMASQRQIDFIFKHISDGLVITDHRWKIKRINEKAEHLLNIKGGGKNLIEVFKTQYEIPPGQKHLFAENRINEKIILYRPATKTNAPLYIRCERTHVNREKEDEHRIIAVLKDVTDELSEQRLKHDFLSLISHKLRSPLTVIGGMTRLLDEMFGAQPDEKQKEVLDAIKKNAIRLEMLVDKLVRFATISNINLQHQQSGAFDPMETSKMTVKNTIYFFGNKTIKTVYHSQLETDFKLSGITEESFSFIISSLVENAIKFSHPQSVLIRMNFAISKKRFVFSISDDGPGIPPEVQERVFESFYQYEKMFTGNVEGMGIGLAMVRQLLEKCQGEIRVESQLEKGVTFIVSIPI